eukprot:s2119_g7.t1
MAGVPAEETSPIMNGPEAVGAAHDRFFSGHLAAPPAGTRSSRGTTPDFTAGCRGREGFWEFGGFRMLGVPLKGSLYWGNFHFKKGIRRNSPKVIQFYFHDSVLKCFIYISKSPKLFPSWSAIFD